jgi:hypothetical protein
MGFAAAVALPPVILRHHGITLLVQLLCSRLTSVAASTSFAYCAGDAVLPVALLALPMLQ